MTANTNTETIVTDSAVVETPAKRGPGRPRKYFTPDEEKAARNEAVKRYQGRVKQAKAEAITKAEGIAFHRLNKADQQIVRDLIAVASK